jgi:muconolactone delta-isomerase
MMVLGAWLAVEAGRTEIGCNMKILALEKSVVGVVDTQFTEELLRTEAAQAWELYQTGVLREIYFTADRHEAVLILECADADAARSCLASLPLVKSGLIDFTVVPLAPYPGFARLFSRS